MAHLLETINGAASFVSARLAAWHQLGTVLPAEFDAAQAMQHANLGGWNVRKIGLQPVPQLSAEGVTTLTIPDHVATVRTNPGTGAAEVLGVVGTGYKVIQNEEHADLLNALVEQSGAHFETAGSLRGGRQVFLSMKLPESMLIGGVDQVDTYLIAQNSHDGSSAFRLMVSPVRVVCANTLAAAIGRAQASFSIRHTVNARAHINAAREALGLTFKFATEFEAAAQAMVQEAMTYGQFRDIIGKLWVTESDSTRSQNAEAERNSALRHLFTEADTNANIRGTRWAGYQAVTEYLDHYAPVAAKVDKARARAERVAAGGATTALKARAFDLIGAL